MRVDRAAPEDRPSRLGRALAALRQVAGMPDYERYLRHARTQHPECPALSERAFYDQYVNTRYGNGASRCC
jgi:uncharacterized short protein YbdD (DUF466 family)